MKRTASVLLLVCILLSSCSVRKIDDGSKPAENTGVLSSEASVTDTVSGGETETVTQTETELPEEEILPVGIYDMTYCDFGTLEEYELQKDYQDDGSGGRDICVFAVFPSQKQKLSGQYFLYIWQDAVSENPGSAGKKIGYLLEYTTPEGNLSNLILRPSDISDKYWDFIEVYIYDDVNQDVTAWHSHLLDEEINDETLVTSFKITAGERISEVSDMRLTAFLYSPDKADEIDSAYIQRHGYTVNVNWYPGRAE